VPVVRPQVLQGGASALNDQMVTRLGSLLEKHRMSFVAFSPLAQGRLLDKFDPKNPPQFEPGDQRLDSKSFSVEAIAALKPKLEKLKARFGQTTEDLAAVALGYVLAQPHVACVIPGFRNERQVRCNLAGAGRAMSKADVEFVQRTLKEDQPGKIANKSFG